MTRAIMALCNCSSSSMALLPIPSSTPLPLLPNSSLSFSIPLSSRNFPISLHSYSPCSSSRPITCRASPKSPPPAASATAEPDLKKDRLPAELHVTETQEPNSSVKLSVVVPPAVCDDCYKRVLREFSKMAKIPGFRPGKDIPEGILLSYVGKKDVQTATVESILKRTLPHAMSSVTGKALKDSISIPTNFSDMEEEYESSYSVSYEILVDVTPEIKWVPENGYKNLKVVVELDSEIGAEEACDLELKRRHKSIGILRIVTDRGLQVGDLAVLDISATTISDAEKIPSAESKGFHFDTEDADKVLPGFLDSIIGIQSGETKSFPLQFPESWRQENLRGVNALFTVDCKELFYRELPEWNDSIAEKLLPGCSTLDQVKESLPEQCQELEQRAKEQATDNAILDQLRQMVEVEIPRSLFEEQGRQLYGAKLLQIQARMKIEEEQLASLTSPKAVNEYLEHEKENIAEVIKQNLAVGDIFQRENLEFSTDEVVKEVENSIQELKAHQQEYDEDRVKEQVQEVLEGAKVLEWLKQHADIHYITK